jgi:hypothetical protein
MLWCELVCSLLCVLVTPHACPGKHDFVPQVIYMHVAPIEPRSDVSELAFLQRVAWRGTTRAATNMDHACCLTLASIKDETYCHVDARSIML